MFYMYMFYTILIFIIKNTYSGLGNSYLQYIKNQYKDIKCKYYSINAYKYN